MTWYLQVKVAQSCLTVSNPMDYTVHGILQARIRECEAFPFSKGSSQPRDQNPCLPHCRWILKPAEPQGKPKNTGVGSLYLLQRIFLTQELNQGLLQCRWILYQLSYEGSPWLWSNEKKLTLKFKLLEIFYLSNIILKQIFLEPLI